MKVKEILSTLSLMTAVVIFAASANAQCDTERCQVLFAAYKWDRGLCGKKCEVNDTECINNDIEKCKTIFFQDPNNKKYCGGCTFTNYNW